MAVFSSLRALSEEDNPAKNPWLAEKCAELEGWRTLPVDQQLEELCGTIRAMGRHGKNTTEDQQFLLDAARSELVSVEGFDTFLEEKIQYHKRTLRDNSEKNSYDRERMRFFETMRYLAHPKIIRILGELLNDNEDVPPPPREGQDYVDYPANNKMAATTLGWLLENPPVRGNPILYFDHDIETWKLWYAQLKPGTRGFKLKGDPTVHYLAKAQEKSGSISNPPPSRTESEIRVKKAEPVNATVPPERPFPLIGTLIASGLLLLSIGWMIISKRKVRVEKT